jgi:two-component system, NarL family, sensor histidine kinase DevS
MSAVAGPDPREALFPILDGALAAAEAGGEIDVILAEGLERVLGAVGGSRGAVFVKDPTTGGLHLRTWSGAGEPAADGGEGLALAPEREELQAALARGQVVQVGDRGLAAAWLATTGLERALLVPMRARGETIGVLALAPSPGGDFGPRHRDVALAAGRVLALALRNAQLFAGLQERAGELDHQVRQLIALSEVTRAVARSLDASAVQRTIVREARRLVRADMAVLLQVGEDGELVQTATDGLREGEEPPGAAAAAGAMQEGVARTLEGPALAMPLLRGRGLPALGVLLLGRRRPDPFVEDDTERLVWLTDQATVALTNAQLLSDLRREQADRRRLAAALVEAQEQERRRIAEQIHDGPVQELVGLSLLLDAVVQDLEEAEATQAAEECAYVAGHARSSVRALRQVIFDLHPLALDELGFTAATRSVSERLAQAGVAVEVDVDAADALPQMQRTVAFRVIQEALANVGRHARATHTRIEAREVEGRMEVRVADDGRGFDPAAATGGLMGGHLGLSAMRQRAALAGGAIRIESAPGAGTTVKLTLPMSEEAAGG